MGGHGHYKLTHEVDKAVSGTKPPQTQQRDQHLFAITFHEINAIVYYCSESFLYDKSHTMEAIEVLGRRNIVPDKSRQKNGLWCTLSSIRPVSSLSFPAYS